MQTQLVGNLGGVHGILSHVNISLRLSDRVTNWQILLVGEDQKNGISELILVQHSLEFLPSLDNTVTIVAVDNEDDSLGILEVMSPERSDLVLSSNIPYSELNVLVLDRLDVEAWAESD